MFGEKPFGKGMPVARLKERCGHNSIGQRTAGALAKGGTDIMGTMACHLLMGTADYCCIWNRPIRAHIISITAGYAAQQQYDKP